jgi:hypothetical protein
MAHIRLTKKGEKLLRLIPQARPEFASMSLAQLADLAINAGAWRIHNRLDLPPLKDRTDVRARIARQFDGVPPFSPERLRSLYRKMSKTTNHDPRT